MPALAALLGDPDGCRHRSSCCPSAALVTTIKAGMADPVWPTTPWYLS